MRVVQISLLMSVFLSSSFSYAQKVHLFENGKPIHDYDEKVEDLGVGDEIVFSDGKVFRIHKVLGSGYSETILEIEGNKAIRIPLDTAGWRPGAFSAHVDHYNDFVTSELPVVQVFPSMSVPGEYTVVGKVDIQTTVDQYLRDRKTLSENERTLYDSKLVEFAKKTWNFEFIADFKPANLAFTKAGQVVLLDWNSRVVKAEQDYSHKTVFDDWNKAPEDLRHQLIQAAQTERSSKMDVCVSQRQNTNLVNLPQVDGSQMDF